MRSCAAARASARAPNNICVPMPAFAVRLRRRPSVAADIFHTCARVARNIGKRSDIRLGVGSSKSRIRGSTACRKLRVRYEKTHRSYLALNMLAAAIISFRRVPTRLNIIYG